MTAVLSSGFLSSYLCAAMDGVTGVTDPVLATTAVCGSSCFSSSAAAMAVVLAVAMTAVDVAAN